jgi:hypothetical protein
MTYTLSATDPDNDTLSFAMIMHRVHVRTTLGWETFHELNRDQSLDRATEFR